MQNIVKCQTKGKGFDLLSTRVTIPSFGELSVKQWGVGDHYQLFLHGIGEAGMVWQNIVTPYRSVAIDLRGHGDSDWCPSVDYGSDVLYSDIKQVIKAQGHSPVALVGHSLGAEIALKFAVAHPEHLSRLVLIDFSPEEPTEIITYIYTQLLKGPFRFNSINDYIKILDTRYPLASDTRKQTFAKTNLRNDCSGDYIVKTDPKFISFLQVLASKLEFQTKTSNHIWDLLCKVSCPTLIVRGQMSSLLSQQTALRMVQQLNNAQYVEIPMAGHSIIMDNPHCLADVLRDFIGKSPPKSYCYSCDVLRLEQIPGIVELGYGFARTFQPHPPQNRAEFSLVWQPFIQSILKDRYSVIIVAYEQNTNKPLGYILGSSDKKQNVWSGNEKCVVLRELFVRTEKQGRGIGTALLSAFEQWTCKQNISIIRLKTPSKHEQSIRFYKKMGFKAHDVILRKQICD